MEHEKIVPDTSIIIEGLLSQKIKTKELHPKFVLIHEAVVAELESQANKGRETGLKGLEEIKAIRSLAKEHKFEVQFKGSRPGDFEIRYAKSGEIDSIIRELAVQEQATLFTADKVQATVAESKGISVILYEFTASEKPFILVKYFTEDTMSVHLKEGCVPRAKKGMPGNWEFVKISKDLLSADALRDMGKEILEEASLRDDSFIEVERRSSSIVQIANYRIVITRPPFSDGYEITAVRPIKKLSLSDYKLSEKLAARIAEKAEGILIAGPPGHGKSTFCQALAEFYLTKNKVIKTIETPRDLVLSDEITQYSLSHGASKEMQDILLLSRPDYTLFDEMRSTEDFRLYSDLRLSGVGMVGVVHATACIDAIQRFIGRIELGVIPHVMDTVIFIQNGKIDKVFSVGMQVKVPAGMTEADLARPVVVVHDFESGKLEFEVYSYGEETIVIPVKIDSISPAARLAIKPITEAFVKYSDKVEVEMVSDNKCVVYVEPSKKMEIIGPKGENIQRIEEKLGLSIDVRELSETKKKKSNKDPIPYEVKHNKSNITFHLAAEYTNKDVDIIVDNDYLLTAHSSKKADLKMTSESSIGKILVSALKKGKKVELKV
ncbi:MAG: PINc/VapC family ATPase [Nanoarchaeota archaeon]